MEARKGKDNLRSIILLAALAILLFLWFQYLYSHH